MTAGGIVESKSSDALTSQTSGNKHRWTFSSFYCQMSMSMNKVKKHQTPVKWLLDHQHRLLFRDIFCCVYMLPVHVNDQQTDSSLRSIDCISLGKTSVCDLYKYCTVCSRCPTACFFKAPTLEWRQRPRTRAGQVLCPIASTIARLLGASCGDPGSHLCNRSR